LMHSDCAQYLILNIRPFEVPLATLSLPGPWWPCCLCGAGMDDRSSLCGQRPTLSRTHHHPASISAVSSALCLDSSRLTTSSVLLQFLLQPLLYGPPHALLQTLISSDIGSLLSREATTSSRQAFISFQPTTSPFLERLPLLLGRLSSLFTRHSHWLPSLPDGRPSELLLLEWPLL
jgi:hypothetical protein